MGGLAGRVRLLPEVTEPLLLFGQTLIASGEAGGRLERGAGLEAGGRLSWRKSEKSLDLSAHGQTLLWQSSAFYI